MYATRYPACFALLWSDVFESSRFVWDLASYDFIRQLCYNEVMLPCLAITGGTSGLLIHFALRPLVVGRQGGDWRKLAGSVLLALTVGLGAMCVGCAYLKAAAAAAAAGSRHTDMHAATETPFLLLEQDAEGTAVPS
jgi:hypothetical protein